MSNRLLYVRINDLVIELRQLKGENAQLRERNAELERDNLCYAAQESERIMSERPRRVSFLDFGGTVAE